MNIVITEEAESLAVRAAEFLAEKLRQRPHMLLCAATGDTPTRAYKLFADRARREPAFASQMRIIKLDEWGGLAMNDSGTCETYLQRHLIAPLNVTPDRYFSFRSDAPDPNLECRRMQDQLVQLGRIDVCILGLGINGHLALNEPADFLQPFAHVAELSPSSLRHPMLHQSQLHVRYGLTLGIADIMAARRILFLVSGTHKREPMRQLLERHITPRFPASFLWMHPDVTCLCNRAALEGLILP